MKFAKSRRLGTAVLSVTAFGLFGTANAQSTTGSVGPTAISMQPIVTGKLVPAMSFKKTAVSQITDALSKATGMRVVTNSLIAAVRVDFTTAGGTLDSVLVELSAVLPPSGTVRAALVPTTASLPQGPDGDIVAAFLTAQDALAKPSPAAARSGTPAASIAEHSVTAPTFKPGEFEALGRRITAEKAAALSADMDLSPVYLVSLTRPLADPISKLSALQAEAIRNYQAMTPDERKRAVEQQFNDMMNMDKGARQALLSQMMDQGAYMVNMMKNMPPDQLAEFNQEMQNAMQSSGMLGALGGKGGATGK